MRQRLKYNGGRLTLSSFFLIKYFTLRSTSNEMMKGVSLSLSWKTKKTVDKIRSTQLFLCAVESLSCVGWSSSVCEPLTSVSVTSSALRTMTFDPQTTYTAKVNVLLSLPSGKYQPAVNLSLLLQYKVKKKIKKMSLTEKKKYISEH